MNNFNDFELDVTTKKAAGDVAEPQITSKFLCTPGCVTGLLQTCFIKTVTCGCSFG